MLHSLRLSLLTIAALVASAFDASAQGLVINEIMSANLGEALDPSWNYGGWIELYNPSERAVSLATMTLTDHRGHSSKLTKAHGEVPAHGFRCLWFGHYDAKNFPSQIDFKLDCDGGYISLSDGSTTATATYPAAISRTSWARVADGSDSWAHCAWPTPQSSNSGASFADRQLQAPQPSHDGGWIDGAVSFSVDVPDGAELYYTTDGTVPSLSSQRASLPAHFTVESNTVYRFRAIADGFLPSPVVTRSFITRSYTKEVADEWWDGWDWGGWGGNEWGGTHQETTTFTGFALLSITADPADLYDDERGLYVDGTNGGWSYWGYANYYRDWDRPVNVEIFDAEGLPLVNQEADMSMAGGYSRMNSVKSFKLKTGKQFDGRNFFATIARGGTPTAEGGSPDEESGTPTAKANSPNKDTSDSQLSPSSAPIFPEKPYVRYKDLLVRAGGDELYDRHQDNALQTIARRSGLYIDSQAFRPVYVFFNGEYIETLLLREPSNKQYGHSNYAMDTDRMDNLEESDITGVTLVNGSWDAFGLLYDTAAEAPANAESWATICSLLDVDEYANYFALETFLANEDWPQNNIKMFRENPAEASSKAAKASAKASEAPSKAAEASANPAEAPSHWAPLQAPLPADAGRYHVVLQDLDACFHESGNTFDRMEQHTFYPYAVAGRQENILLTLFLNLMRFEEFRQRFVTAYSLMAGSVFRPDAVRDDLDALQRLFAEGYVEKATDLHSVLTSLQNKLSDTFCQKRIGYLRKWSRANINTARAITATIDAPLGATLAAPLTGPIPLPRNAFSGTLYLPLTLQAHPIVGQTFVGWQRTTGSKTQTVANEPTLQLVEDGTYTPLYSPTDDAPPLVINELSASNDIYQSPRLKRSDWIELYNLTDQPVDLAGCFISADADTPLAHQISDLPGGTIIPPHGHRILWADGQELPFKLSLPASPSDGIQPQGTVVLTAPDGAWQTLLSFPHHGSRQSVGRWPDGGQNLYIFDRPTIAGPNLLTSYARSYSTEPVLVGSPSIPASTDSKPAPGTIGTYDTAGRRVGSSTQHGVVISGGRKQTR